MELLTDAERRHILTPSVTHAKDMPMKTESWVIRNKLTGEVLFETFLPTLVAKLNTAKYEAVPIYQYLCELNAKIKTQAQPLR